MNHYTNAMRHYVDFEGHASRTQYWLYTLTLFGITVVALALDLIIDDQSAEPAAFFTGMVVLAHFIPSLAISARRLHDIGKSAWWLLLMLAPGIGSIVLLVFMCTPTKTGENRFNTHIGETQSVERKPHFESTEQSSLHQLEKIASLRATGAIDEDEFKQLKANVLARSSL